MSQLREATRAKPLNPVMQAWSPGCRRCSQQCSGQALPFPLSPSGGKAQLKELLCLLSPSTLLLLGNWLLTGTTSHSRQVVAY